MPHFQTTRRVEFHDTDLAGIIHFSNYFLYMEQAEHELFRSLGLKIHGHFPDGTVYGWPRVSTTASFSAPAHYDDLLDVRLTCCGTERGRSRCATNSGAATRNWPSAE
jgi:acyl-CoA thioester hydrolase